MQSIKLLVQTVLRKYPPCVCCVICHLCQTMVTVHQVTPSVKFRREHGNIPSLNLLLLRFIQQHCCVSIADMCCDLCDLQLLQSPLCQTCSPSHYVVFLTSMRQMGSAPVFFFFAVRLCASLLCLYKLHGTNLKSMDRKGSAGLAATADSHRAPMQKKNKTICMLAEH